MHRFLESCSSEDPEDIELDKLDFSDMLTQVERREYNAKVPAWIQKLIKQRELETQSPLDCDRRMVVTVMAVEIDEVVIMGNAAPSTTR